MKLLKKLKKVFAPVLLFSVLTVPTVFAEEQETYKVNRGDTLWLISVKYEIGLMEIISANPQIKNPNLIYPNQIINIPVGLYAKEKGIESQVLALVNKERQKVGAKPLQMDWELQRVSRIKSCDMAENNYFSHDSKEYGTPFEMMKSFGIKYKSAGENIASGQKTPEEVMKSWVNSSGHYKNIVDKKFTHLGVGYCEGGSMSPYWTQQFIQK